MFKVKNLLFNVVSNGNGTALVTPGTDISPLTPITPVIRVSKITEQLQRVNFDKIDLTAFNQFTNNVGLNLVAGYCTQDMATCNNNPGISPVASLGDTISVHDVYRLKETLVNSLSRIEEFEKALEVGTRKQAEAIVPTLKDALECIA